MVAGMQRTRPSRMSNFAVPRTSDRVAFEETFAQRTAVVRADVVQGVKLPVDVKHHDELLLELENLFARIGNVAGLAHGHEITHIPAPFGRWRVPAPRGRLGR